MDLRDTRLVALSIEILKILGSAGQANPYFFLSKDFWLLFFYTKNIDDQYNLITKNVGEQKI